MTTAPPLSPEEAATVATFDAAEEPEESYAAQVERVARAILDDWIRRFPNDNEPWEFQREDDREDYLSMARAAIAAMEPVQ